MDERLPQKIKELYDLSEPISLAKIDKGFLSENYKVSADEKSYFLKKYRFENEEKVQEIHSVKRYFFEGGIPVIMPLPVKDRRTFFEYEGSFFSLFPFVSGLQPERGKLSDTMIVSLAHTLGRVHLLGEGVPIKTKDEFRGWNKENALRIVDSIQEKLDALETKSDFDLLAERTITLKKELIQRNSIAFLDLNLRNDHLVHGDYLDQNVFFDEQGSIKYVFDFEKTDIEPRTQELFRSATYSFLNTDFDEISIKNIHLYIRSYREVYPIENDELRRGLMSHYLKSAHSFWVEKEHYLKGNTRVDLFLELNYKRLKFMSDRLGALLV